MRKRTCELRTCAPTPLWNTLLAAAAISVLLTLGTPAATAQVATTTVQGTIYRADGTPASGTVLVSWNAFTTPQNQAVVAGSKSAAIGADGFLSLNLTPNAGALPSGSYYTAVYHLSDGTVYPEYWVVPASGTASVASVRAELAPSTIAVASTVTPAYVQGAVAGLSATYLALTGGTLSGPLTLNGDPVAQNQAATRHYVDQSASQQLPLAGGTLTGPLTVPSLSTKTLEGRLYADQFQSSAGSNNGIAMSVQDCLSLPYACQVLAPALYAQTEVEPWGGAFQWSGGEGIPFRSAPAGPASGQPLGCIEDDRFGGPQWICQTMARPSWAGNPNIAVGPSFTTYNTQPTVPYTFGVAPALALSSYNFFGTTFNNASSQSQHDTLQIFNTNFAESESSGIQLLHWANGNGDSMPMEIDQFQRGGMSTGDSEGSEGRYQMQEAPDVYQGTVNSIANQSGSSNICYGPCTIFNTTQTQGYPGSLGSGLALIDLSQADSSGYVSSISSGAVTATGADWDSKYGDSVHTTVTAQTSTQPMNPLTPNTNVAVQVANATGFTAPGTACITDASGTFWETAPITAVDTTDTPNSITLGTLRSARVQSGSYIAEGGMACMGISFAADNVAPGARGAQGWKTDAPPVNTIRTTWVIAYNSSGNVLQVMSSNEGWGLDTLAWTQMGSGGSVSCTLSDGVVSACTASGGAGYLNGSPTNAPPQLTISGLTGCATPPAIHIANVAGGALSTVSIDNNGTSGCQGTPVVTVTPTNSYSVYPMARTINVFNPATGLVDGSSIATEPPAGIFAHGDTVEQEHYHPESYLLWRQVMGDWQGGTSQEAHHLVVNGRGFSVYDDITNENLPTFYRGYPGGATPQYGGYGQAFHPPTFAWLQGPWSVGLNFQYPLFGQSSAMNAGGAIVINCTVGGVNVCAGWNTYDILINHANSLGYSASDVLEYNPSTETWQWTAGASNQSGTGAACTLDFNTGGFSGNCGGEPWSFDSSGDLALSGSLHAQAAVTGATINGEITVDGDTYATLNAAWTAAVAQANATGQDQTVRLGPGTFAVSATLAEPASGPCVNLIGSAGTTVNADSPQVATTLTVPSPLGGDLFSLGNAQQAQGCTFQNLNILAGGNATHAFEFQWFRGLLLDNVAVNDTSSDGIVLGEENTSSGHQSNFLLRNVTVSFSASAFTPASRPAYGIHIEKTAIDSALDDITVRNALTAAVYNEGTGNTGYLIHGFGYPYTCTTAPCVNNASSASAANASYATSYVVYDTGGSGSEWTDTYVDSPAVAGFYIGANGVSIEGGHIQWPDLTSFPAANLAYVASGVTNNLLIGDVSCLGMANGANWITYAGASGNPPSFSSVHHLTGCGNYYQALEPAVTTGFSSGGANINDPTGAVPRVWATPLASASTDAAYSAQMYTGYQGDVFQAHFSGVNPFFNITYQGTIRSSGGLALSTVINTASTLTLTAANKNVIANAAGGPQTLTLPSCYTPLPDKSAPTGLEFTIIKSDTSSNAVTLQTVSSQNINYNGVSAQTLAIGSPGKRTLVCGPDYNWYAY